MDSSRNRDVRFLVLDCWGKWVAVEEIGGVVEEIGDVGEVVEAAVDEAEASAEVVVSGLVGMFDILQHEASRSWI